MTKPYFFRSVTVATILASTIVFTGCLPSVPGTGVTNANTNFEINKLLRSPETPIKEVIIRGYGNVPDYLLQAAKNAIQQKIGVRINIEAAHPEFAEQPPQYNAKRKQFDADELWDTESGFVNSTQDKRLMMVVDVDVYTELQPERPYVFSRALPNVDVILISTHRFQKLSDAGDQPAPRELAASRMQKLALQTLGISVSLEGSSYGLEPDISCVMYRGRILSELDKQGDNFCGEQKDRLKELFVIEN